MFHLDGLRRWPSEEILGDGDIVVVVFNEAGLARLDLFF